MVAQRIVSAAAKLATTRLWHTTTLGADFGVAQASEDDLYRAMDWLLERQDRIQKKLAKRQLQDDALVLYDLSSSYFEGVCCPLAKLGFAVLTATLRNTGEPGTDFHALGRIQAHHGVGKLT